MSYSYPYAFPEHRSVMSEGFDQEAFEKVEEECQEASASYIEWEQSRSRESEADMLCSVMGVIHACETLLRKYEESVGGIDLMAVRSSVVKRNRRRGCYL